MNFFILVLFLFVVAVADCRFADFIIKDENDLKRFGDDEDISYEDYQPEEDPALSIEWLRQLYQDYPNVFEMLKEATLDEMGKDVLQRLQQYYDNMDSPDCLDDEDTSLQPEDIPDQFGIRLY